MAVDIQSVFKEVHNQGIELTNKYNFFQNILMQYWDRNHDIYTDKLLSRENAKILIVKMYDFYNKKEKLYDNMKEKEKRELFTKFVDSQLEILKKKA